MSQLAEQLASLHARVRAAEQRGARPVGSVELLAVTKGVSAERIAEAIDAGQRTFGENRVQELEEKRLAVAALRPGAEVRWDLIGPLQSNKVRRALVAADRISSVDRVELLQRIAEFCRADASARRILLQVNIDEDPAKSGFTPEALRAALPEIATALSGAPLSIEGLLTVGRLTSDPAEARSTFSAFVAFSHSVREVASAQGLQIGPIISAGMSGDFEVAIEEGATQVRLGSALFGARG
ncbi:MAG: YggS family pyridoxal phosphate-dependent enzyme [Chloroflexi bacterium]|nr:MAG: YggS family pyridoxal phosphate-dependent enzyme [Chloroflexota bacterium]RLT28477.1 MAG: YggS family pyridoxal phosphate-dependent enzyme [Chloroflexota bacterium]